MIAVTVDPQKNVKRNDKNVGPYILQQMTVLDHYIKIDPLTHNDGPFTYINALVLQDDSLTSDNDLFKVLVFDDKSLSVSAMKQLEELTDTEENKNFTTHVKQRTTVLKDIGKTSEILDADLGGINTAVLPKDQYAAATIISKGNHKHNTKDKLDTQKEEIHNLMVEQQKQN